MRLDSSTPRSLRDRSTRSLQMRYVNLLLARAKSLLRKNRIKESLGLRAENHIVDPNHGARVQNGEPNECDPQQLGLEN